MKKILYLLVFIFFLFPFRSVFAATFTIADGDTAGFINAVNDANDETNYPGSDTIELATGGTYTLTAVHNTVSGANAFPVVTSNIIINGNGATIQRDIMAPDFRFFHVDTNGNLTLNNSTITRGDVGTGIGGAIHVFGTLTTSQVNFSNNTGSSAGAVDNNGGIVYINDSVFTYNHTNGWGGAMSLGGTTYVDGSTFSYNDADRGGAISTTDGYLTVSDSVFTHNSAFTSGGAILNNSYNFSLDNSYFFANTAYLAATIYNHSIGPMTVTNSHITGNTASEANGGILSVATLSNTTTLHGNCIEGNTLYSFAMDQNNPTAEATGNWWGSSDGPSGAGPGSGDAVTSNIDFSNWLTSSPDSCLLPLGPSPTPTPTPTPTPVPPQITALSPALVWVGLKNSDDVGIKFDLMAEVYKGLDVIGAGQVNSVLGGSSGFNNAKLDTIPLTLSSPVSIQSGDVLSTKIYVRNACTGSGKNSGTARLWYNDSAANSQFGATIDATPYAYYLLNSFALGTSAGSGSKQTIDQAAGPKCSPFKLFGTWNTTL